jgi:hypothetical protein
MILHHITTKRFGGRDNRMAHTISTQARQDLLGFVASWFTQHGQASNLQEAEALAEEARQLVGQALLEAALLGMGREASYQGASVPCSCGGHARFVTYRGRWIKSLYGEARIERAYYHCGACGSGQVPWDEAQGLTQKLETPHFKAAVSRVMGRLVYADGVQVVKELCGVSIEESTSEAIVEEVGQRVRTAEEAQVALVQMHLEQATKERLLVEMTSEEAPQPLGVRGVQGQRLYLSCDATTAHIDGGWHNVQNAMVFTVKADEEGHDTLLERAYAAGQMDMETLGWRLRTLSYVWNAAGYPELVFLADGAPCNWNLASTHFPGAVLILDFYHASEHVWELSRALYRQDDPEEKALGERWASEHVGSLKKEGPQPLLRALKRQRGKTPAQREALRKARHYFTANADRMNYPEHLRAGRMIGSGPVEAACKSVVGVRLKQAGMRWSSSGADAVLAIRTTLLNGDSARLSEMARAA